MGRLNKLAAAFFGFLCQRRSFRLLVSKPVVNAVV